MSPLAILELKTPTRPEEVTPNTATLSELTNTFTVTDAIDSLIFSELSPTVSAPASLDKQPRDGTMIKDQNPTGQLHLLQNQLSPIQPTLRLQIGLQL